MEDMSVNKADLSKWNNNENQSFEEEIRISKISVSVHQILNWINTGQLEIDKDSRADITWSSHKKAYYIETLLIRFPSPYVYMCEEHDGSRTVIDGNNRIVTLLEFINNEFRLEKNDVFEGVSNCYFTDLNFNIQRRFLDSTVDVCVINSECSPLIRYDIYKRVNIQSDKMLQKYLYSACRPSFRLILSKMEKSWRKYFDFDIDVSMRLGKNMLYKKKLYFQEMSVFWISCVIAFKNNTFNENIVLENIDLVNKLDDSNLENMFEDFEQSISKVSDFINCISDEIFITGHRKVIFILIWSVVFKYWNINENNYILLADNLNNWLSMFTELKGAFLLERINLERMFTAVKTIDRIMEKGNI